MFSEGGTGSAEPPAVATAVAQHTPSPTSTSQGTDSAAITDPTASAPSPPGDPAPPIALPPTGRISTRTRRGTAAGACAAPPGVDYGFGPSGAPRPSARRANTPPRVPRLRPPLVVVTAPAPAASTAPTVTIPSGRDCAEPEGTPLFRRLPSPDVSSAKTVDLDALGAAAELELGDSAARHSHAEWARERRAEPACPATMRYIVLGRPPSLPADVLSCFPSHQRSSFSEIQERAGKGRLHTTDDGTILLVRQPTSQPPSFLQHPVRRAACLLNSEPVPIYVPLLMRRWAMQACHSTVSCLLSTTCTLRMLERFYWWIGMYICTRWWLHQCPKCQVRKTLRMAVRGPSSRFPFPKGPALTSASISSAPLRSSLQENLHPALH